MLCTIHFQRNLRGRLEEIVGKKYKKDSEIKNILHILHGIHYLPFHTEPNLAIELFAYFQSRIPLVQTENDANMVIFFNLRAKNVL